MAPNSCCINEFVLNHTQIQFGSYKSVLRAHRCRVAARLWRAQICLALTHVLIVYLGLSRDGSRVPEVWVKRQKCPQKLINTGLGFTLTQPHSLYVPV